MGHYEEHKNLYEALKDLLEESAMYDVCLDHRDRMKVLYEITVEFNDSWKDVGVPKYRYFLEDGETGAIIDQGRSMTEKEVNDSNEYFRSMRLPLNWHPCLP